MTPYQNSGRYMKFNHSGALPRYIVSLDTETLPTPVGSSKTRFSHKFRLAVGVSVRLRDEGATDKKVFHFRTIDEVWTTIKSLTAANYTTWIVCHNAMFDMLISGMGEQFERGEITLDWPRSVRTKTDTGTEGGTNGGFACLESPPFIVPGRFGITQGRIVIVDTLNWFQCSLAELGLSCELPKSRMPAFDRPDNEWFAYCERDAEIVLKSFTDLIFWVRNNDMGMFRYTGPSQAIAAYRHRWLKKPILLHDNMPVKCLERAAYFGGRFEVFKHGQINQRVHQYDVNALFPSVMKYNPFPVALDRYELNTKWELWRGQFNPLQSVAEVDVISQKTSVPVRTDKGIVFPIGRFKTVACGAELHRLCGEGSVYRVRAFAEYRTDYIFEQWVDDLWKMRNEYKASGNKLYNLFTKMLMNSLYGKFAQRSPEWVNRPDDPSKLPFTQWIESDPRTGESRHFRMFGYQRQERVSRDVRHDPNKTVNSWEDHCSMLSAGELSTTFIAVSAFVTSAARRRMDYFRAIAGRQNVFYQGVDSVVVNDQGRDLLESSGMVSESELGLLRHQLTADNGEIFGCSDYRLGEKVIVAGLSKRKSMTEQQHQMQRRFYAKDRLFAGPGTNDVIEDNVEWMRSANFWKGVIGQDGWVAPLELGVTGSSDSTPVTAKSNKTCAASIAVET